MNSIPLDPEITATAQKMHARQISQAFPPRSSASAARMASAMKTSTTPCALVLLASRPSCTCIPAFPTVTGYSLARTSSDAGHETSTIGCFGKSSETHDFAVQTVSVSRPLRDFEITLAGFTNASQAHAFARRAMTTHAALHREALQHRSSGPAHEAVRIQNRTNTIGHEFFPISNPSSGGDVPR